MLMWSLGPHLNPTEEGLWWVTLGSLPGGQQEEQPPAGAPTGAGLEVLHLSGYAPLIYWAAVEERNLSYHNVHMW